MTTDHAANRILAIAALHKYDPEAKREVCKECRRAWPCATSRFCSATPKTDEEAYAVILKQTA